MSLRFAPILLFAVSTAPACGSGDAAKTDGEAEKAADTATKTVYACNAPSENASNCVEWHGGAFPDESAAKQECSANRGQYAGNACPLEDVVARCVRHKGTMMEQHELWYGPKMTAQAIEAGCKGPDTEFRAG